MNLFLFCSCVLLFPLFVCVFGDDWGKIFSPIDMYKYHFSDPNDFFEPGVLDIVLTASGNSIAVIEKISRQSNHYFIVKFDPSGDIAWIRRIEIDGDYPESYYIEARIVDLSEVDGSYIFHFSAKYNYQRFSFGEKHCPEVSTEHDAFVHMTMKISSDGELVWKNNFKNGDFCSSKYLLDENCQCPEGIHHEYVDIVKAGSFSDSSSYVIELVYSEWNCQESKNEELGGTSERSLYLTKFDPFGNIQYVKKLSVDLSKEELRGRGTWGDASLSPMLLDSSQEEEEEFIYLSLSFENRAFPTRYGIAKFDSDSGDLVDLKLIDRTPPEDKYHARFGGYGFHGRTTRHSGTPLHYGTTSNFIAVLSQFNVFRNCRISTKRLLECVDFEIDADKYSLPSDMEREKLISLVTKGSGYMFVGMSGGTNEEYTIIFRCLENEHSFIRNRCERGRSFRKDKKIVCGSETFLEEFFVHVDWETSGLPRVTLKRLDICSIAKRFQASSLFEPIRKMEKGEYVTFTVQPVRVVKKEGKNMFIFKLIWRLVDKLGEDKEMKYYDKSGYNVEIQYAKKVDLLILSSEDFFEDQNVDIIDSSAQFNAREEKNLDEDLLIVEDYTHLIQKINSKEVDNESGNILFSLDDVKVDVLDDDETEEKKFIVNSLGDYVRVVDISIMRGFIPGWLWIVVVFSLLVISSIIFGCVFVYYKKKKLKAQDTFCESESESEQEIASSVETTSSSETFDSAMIEEE